MRFLCVNQPVKANIFGQDYQLGPLDSKIENLEDILCTDNFSASELLSRHKDVLLEISFETANFHGFPRIVNRLSDINPGGKILILRNGGIGDHVMLLPALRVFREMFPKGSHVWLAAQKEKHPIFRNNCDIDELLPLPLRLNTLLKADYLIDFSGRDDWYDDEHIHVTDSYLNFLEIDYANIKGKTTEIVCDFSGSPRIFNLFKRVREEHPGKPLILLNWKASNRLRDLPPKKLLFLVNGFRDSLFVIAQSKEQGKATSKILKGYGDNLLDFSSEMGSLENYMAAIANCDAVVSTDTATGHLAEALGKPSLILYGPTRDDLWIRYCRRVYPVRADYSGETCRSPCGLTKNTKNGCPEAMLKKSFYSPCLLSISQEKIETSFIEFMKGVD